MDNPDFTEVLSRCETEQEAAALYCMLFGANQITAGNVKPEEVLFMRAYRAKFPGSDYDTLAYIINPDYHFDN